ncbi:DUF1876 domain-containing protein [Nonomuraea africana]|uniref:DUF1876 domain-containing protein n=1 Tax=Nonomuraea africana TaxID=46171 RepID=A0ABR9KME5_9ACTN|nr:DUF1876 domain-containing protein [Nonomuraea africana]MBE1562783.1 hypothetical protein [Nonomuraea africana]
MNEKRWVVEIDITEEGDLTKAHATLSGGRLAGYGEAHRNPIDPPAPEIGDELAAGRALQDLTHQLLGTANMDVAQNAATTPS